MAVIADQHEGDRREQGDAAEVLARVERHLGVEAAVGRERARGTHTHGVAVRRRLRDDAHADVPPGTWPVLHHDRLPQVLVELRNQHAHDGVRAAAGREGHHHLDALARVVCLLRSRDG